MRNLILIGLFLIFGGFQSPSTEQKEEVENIYHIGKMDFYMTEDNYYYIEYKGKYHVCEMKELIDALFECDTFYEEQLNQIYAPKNDTIPVKRI